MDENVIHGWLEPALVEVFVTDQVSKTLISVINGGSPGWSIMHQLAKVCKQYTKETNTDKYIIIQVRFALYNLFGNRTIIMDDHRFILKFVKYL